MVSGRRLLVVAVVVVVVDDTFLVVIDDWLACGCRSDFFLEHCGGVSQQEEWTGVMPAAGCCRDLLDDWMFRIFRTISIKHK